MPLGTMAETWEAEVSHNGTIISQRRMDEVTTDAIMDEIMDVIMAETMREIMAVTEIGTETTVVAMATHNNINKRATTVLVPKIVEETTAGETTAATVNLSSISNHGSTATRTKSPTRLFQPSKTNRVRGASPPTLVPMHS
jgi:type II secretory pathway predicted ATPase ExeA